MVLNVCLVRISSFPMFVPAVQIYTAMYPLNVELRRHQEFGKPVEVGSGRVGRSVAVHLPAEGPVTRDRCEELGDSGRAGARVRGGQPVPRGPRRSANGAANQCG